MQTTITKFNLIVKSCIKKQAQCLAHVSSKNVSCVNNISDRQESWDELRKLQHLSGPPIVPLHLFCGKLSFSHSLKIRSSPPNFLATHRNKAISKVTSICKTPTSQFSRTPSSRESKSDWKWNSSVLCFFPSLLPRLSDTFGIRAWEERKGKRSRDVFICWSWFLEWLLQSVVKGFKVESLWAFLWVLQRSHAGPPSFSGSVAPSPQSWWCSSAC